MGCHDRHRASNRLSLQKLLWVYCPGHAGVCGNERADRLATTADITSGLQLAKAEVFRGLRNFLNTGRPEHYSTGPLKERGVELRNEVADIPLFEVGNDLCSTRQTLAPLRAHMGLSKRYDAILKLKLILKRIGERGEGGG